MAVLGLRCSSGYSLVVASGSCSRVAVHGLLIAVASPIAEHGHWGTQASVVAMQGLSCSAACGIFPDQG